MKKAILWNVCWLTMAASYQSDLPDAGSARTERLFNRSVPVHRTERIVHSGLQLDRDQLVQMTS